MAKKLIVLLFLVSIFTLNSPSAYAQGYIADGLYLIYDSSGILGALETHKSLKRDGVVFNYYKNGDVKKLFWYKQGRPHGTAKAFAEDGSLKKKKTYRNGRLIDVKKYK